MHNCSMCLKPVNRCECGPGKVHEVRFVPPVEGAPVFVGYGAGGPRATLTPAGQELLKEIRAGETVNHPSHYNRGSIETIDYLKETLSPEGYEGFLQGNILKYMSRYQLKAGVDDLMKARRYLNWLIEFKTKTPAK